MNLGWQAQFDNIVLPAWASYLDAETALSAAHEGGSEKVIEVARYRALREGGSVSFYLNHYADIVANEQPPQLPADVGTVRDVRAWVAGNCRYLRSGGPIDDVQLLADVADALKHAKLTRRPDERQVEANDAVLVAGQGWGEGPSGEGKFGGYDQVLVLAKSGTRVLSAILQNVFDAWRVSMGWPLPPISEVFSTD
ncbi:MULTISPECIES: hypothetical protein [unclassified Aurantimonas]|uniref:hypothetical protein n=1 Tax=unclassified Aurantimonas TaxID=2638230 RepID=UPI002E194076|nr:MULTISPECIES: hypothetical protein [unclassified Aurantimonas]MEC5293456.1 hypothetical protein [Aurantimonas sp. C2-3-R2]MEC5414400.1 hypothetical protein [Aurantimonas sp. C2-4-R8]